MGIKRILIYIFIISVGVLAKTNNKDVFYQTVKGTVRDTETGLPLKSVNVVLENQEPVIGTATDSTGLFNLTCKTGRIYLLISHIGYQTQSIPILVKTRQEYVINVGLEPQTIEMPGVVLTAPFQKEKPINNLVYASGRSFSTDEAYRYAGTLGDAARMVRSYPGIMPERDDRNDIVIRGNSPMGLLWRIDGIEIPNPNHYGGIGLTGSTVTLLNINMLRNSDFLTGAFPAEYGNALSGVFDLKTKKANSDHHEFRLQTGWNGFEFGVEGPFSKRRSIGTYMACYRYSFLDFIDKIGINFGVLPKYQDFTTKFDFNVSENFTVSTLALWGTSFIEIDDHDRDTEEIKTLYGKHIKTGSDMLLGAVNLKYKINIYNDLFFSFSALNNKINNEIDTFNLATDLTARIWEEQSLENKYSFFGEYRNNAMKNNYFNFGFRWDIYDINYSQEGINWDDEYATIINSDALMNFFRFYVQDEYRFTNRFKITFGTHTQQLFYNNSFAVEPRGALQYKFSDRQWISLAYGKHHQMQARTIYFIETHISDGVLLTNKNLDFSEADHFVMSYDLITSKNSRLKSEVYYQYLQDIPVEDDINSAYSMLNSGANFYIETKDNLVNKGKGKNYGVELTLEKFLADNYYFTLNGTLYNSQYTGGDGVWRNTAFNTSYIFNGIFGYEWWATKNKAFGVDLKMTRSGGKPYIPVKEEASIDSAKVVYDYDKAYSVRYNDYFRTDLKLYYKMNFRKFYIEFAVDFQNLTNNKNIFAQEFVPETGEYSTYYHMEFFPMYTFKCLF